MVPNHRVIGRRQFLGASGSVMLGAAAIPGSATSAGARADQAGNAVPVPRAVLGRTGAEVGRLGLGCAHFQWPHVTIDDTANVLHRALELGVDYLDVAPNYGSAEGSFSEEKMGPTIPEIRDKVFLVSKSEEPTYDGTWRLIRQSLKRLRTDRLDLVHLHNVGEASRFPDIKAALGPQGALAALREAKKSGVIRFIGASGHLHPSIFHAVMDTGEIDVLMNAVNFVSQHTYDFEHKVWSRARELGLGLVAMKVLGGRGGRSSTGRGGFRLPEDQYENAIRYALSLPGLSVAVIGLENVEELDRAARTVATAAPLTPEEAHKLSLAGLELAATDDWRASYGEPLT